jgi:hypothetical protein
MLFICRPGVMHHPLRVFDVHTKLVIGELGTMKC